MSKFKQLAKMLGLSESVVKNIPKESLEVLQKTATEDAAMATLNPNNAISRAEYLKALDDAYGNVAARQKLTGFDSGDWYHGTTVPIDQFKNEALGLSTGAQSAKKGFFFAKDPSTASDYANLASEKGLIREGDKVTTRHLSETADLHNEAYDLARDLSFQRDTALGNIQRATERLENSKKVLNQRLSNLKEGKIGSFTKEEYLSDLEELKNKIQQQEQFINSQRLSVDDFSKQIKNIEDKIGSTGQNVLPVKLKGKNLRVKDYQGQGYRDTTYADEMNKALEHGNDAVVFKNTYDPADPNNRILQNIAAVFEPNQIRSKFAAFDPRHAKSSNLLASLTGVTTAGAMLSPSESEASPYSSLIKKLGGMERKEALKLLEKKLGHSTDELAEVSPKLSEKQYDDLAAYKRELQAQENRV